MIGLKKSEVATKRLWAPAVAGLASMIALAACEAPISEREKVGTTHDALCSATCTCGANGDLGSNVLGVGGACADVISTSSDFPSGVSPNPIISLNYGGDVDWYRFTTPSRAGTFTYSFQTITYPTGNPTTNVACDLFTPSTYFWKANDDAVPAANMNCQLNWSTSAINVTYYVRVRGSNNTVTGQYAALVVLPPTGDGPGSSQCSSCTSSGCTPDVPSGCVADRDYDDYPDTDDNCLNTANDQSDQDEDGIGDACDNCPLAANAGQGDSDSDGIGDACDNCPSVSNHDQLDSNSNGVGDACEFIDGDHDGVPDAVDNCPSVANANQADFNHNGIGDACDPDADGDGVLNASDVCANTPAGAAVATKSGFTGCSGAQVVALKCPNTQPVETHACYVTCVSGWAYMGVQWGILTKEQSNALTQTAMQTY